MRDFLKSRFFIVITVLCVVFVVVPSVLSALGMQNYVRSAVNIVMTPLQKCFNAVTDALDGFTAYFTEFDDIVAENVRLKTELAELSDRLYNAEKTENLNEWLSEFLEMKRAHTDFTFAEASITGRESVNYMTVFTIDRGSAHGIAEGMPVVTPDGVLGYVDEVGLTWGKVRTLIEASTSIGACIERTGELGLVEGNYTLASEGLCRITYLAADSDVAVGDRVITSGYGSVYPRGLVIGIVTEIVPDAYSRTLSAYIRPSAELSDLDRVMIVTSYETTVS
ncbi:MAG: rod shape-determining protein MreC [Eubacteriales bacterium]